MPPEDVRKNKDRHKWVNKDNEVVKDRAQREKEASDSLSVDAFEFIGRMAKSRRQGNKNGKSRK
ncbi:MAG: hypothetical protein VYC23_05480 [Chloroflexota bacterium]|nr:hypothetical protein [Chloroflexota bacterium]